MRGPTSAARQRFLVSSRSLLQHSQGPGRKLDRERIADYAARGIDAFAMELMPRISRAQSMDVLSSQSNLAGYKAVIDRLEIHDLHATMLHLLGVDHQQLTYRYQGRDFRLTDVHGEVVHQIIA